MTILLLLISQINDWKQPYVPVTEHRVGNVTYGTYLGGGYTARQVGSVVIINHYTAPQYPVGGLPRTVISYGPRNSPNRCSSHQLERVPAGR